MKDLKFRISMVIFLGALTLATLRPTNAVISHLHKKPARSFKKSSWQTKLQKEFAALEKQYPNQIGLFIKDLNTGEEYALHGEENWYLASTVKIPIAIEVLRQVDLKKISLDDKVKITLDDYIDGNGPLKNMKVGSSVTIKYLIEQMIVWSDNTASDMLIRVVGLDKVNTLVQGLSPIDFSPITTLKDVRRHIFSGLHTRAFELSGQSFIKLKRIQNHSEKLNKFASLLKVEKKQMNLQSIHEAYDAYYQKGLNSATPRSYAKILEALWEGKILTPDSRDFLLHTMLKTQTGKNRIRAGLKQPWVFAHKTGTQYRRIGDVGYIWNPDNLERKPLILISFVRDIPEHKTSARVLERVAKIISQSGVL